MTAEAITKLEEALARARAAGNTRDEGLAALRLGKLLAAMGQWHPSQQALRAAAASLAGSDEHGPVLEASLILAGVRLEQGYFPEAEALAETVAGPQSPEVAALALAIQGAAQVHQGRSAEGLMLLEQAALVARASAEAGWARQVAFVSSSARLVLGQFDEALAMLPSGEGALGDRAALVRAEAALQQGDLAGVEALLTPLYAAAPMDVQLRSRLLWAQMALASGQVDPVAETLAGLRPLLPDLDSPRLEGEVLLLEAELAARRGGDVSGHVEAALRLLEATHQQHSLVRVLGLSARHGAPAGRAAAATRARDLAQALARPLGPDAERYLAAYGRGDIAPPAPPPPAAAAAPSSIGELRDLVRRLEAGLSHIEQHGGMASGAGGAEAPWQLDRVIGFARAVNSTLDVPTVMSRAVALSLEAVSADQGLIVLKEPGDVYTHHYQAARSYRDDLWGGEQLCRELGQEVLKTGEPIVVSDPLGDARRVEQTSVYALEPQAMLVLPLRNPEGMLFGALCVTRRADAGVFTELEREMAQAFASLISQAIANASLLRAQEERRVHLEMLNRLYRTISRTLELSKVLDLIAEMTLEVTKAERAFILLWENDQLQFGAGRDKEGPLPSSSGREVSNTACQKVVETQQGVYVFDTGADSEFNSKLSVVSLKLGSIVAVPLMGQSGLIGVLYIDSKTQSLAALERELSVLTAVANIASLSVENARLYRQATVDGLTGLYARSFFLHRMDEEIRRANRYGGCFSLLVMDIDHFKKFNDTHGHQTGDAVIKLVAKIIRDTIREGLDLPGRYGGEEMVLLLPETDTEGAQIVAERIRERIASAVQLSPSGEALRVTISLGVATFPAMADTGATLFEKADLALYASKHAGRNKTTVYAEDMEAAGEPQA